MLVAYINNSRSFIDFQIWDFPGQIDFFDEMAYDPQDIFGTVGALIFVIDAQDDYSEALHRLFSTVTSAYRVNPNITFEVLIHKVDGLSDDYKIGKLDSLLVGFMFILLVRYTKRCPTKNERCFGRCTIGIYSLDLLSYKHL